MSQSEEPSEEVVHDTGEQPSDSMDGISQTIDGTVDAQAVNATAQQSFGSPPPGAEYGYGI
ncbi:hypothetical protein [Planctomycetes bacterium TBK1r]|uniref:Uncharacterized protein n=1 Tax=Stieleria magnilauensis TaxID=2527963 RepID=A0ABX5Y5D9_9BACT|nr:hypothetical protein TBK1r_74680 [Planctomycetes bacterium TBK1r]